MQNVKFSFVYNCCLVFAYFCYITWLHAVWFVLSPVSAPVKWLAPWEDRPRNDASSGTSHSSENSLRKIVTEELSSRVGSVVVRPVDGSRDWRYVRLWADSRPARRWSCQCPLSSYAALVSSRFDGMLERIRQTLSSMRSYQLSTVVKERLEFFNPVCRSRLLQCWNAGTAVGWVHSHTGCVERGWVGSPYIQISSSNRYEQPHLRLKFYQSTLL